MSPQMEYMNDKASSPKVSPMAMMLSCAIAAKENQYVVLTDIRAAFLHSEIEGTVHILLKGAITEL